MARQSGGRLTGLMADVLAETMRKHMAVTLPGVQAAKVDLYSIIMERLERASAAQVNAVVGELLDLPDLPAEAKAVLQTAVAPAHQDQILVAVAALIGSLFAVTAAAAQPYAAMFSAAAWRSKPELRLTPEQLAAGLVRDLLSEPAARAEARESGLTQPRFGILTGLIGNPPGVQDMLEAYRRGIINKGRLEHGIRQSDLRNEWIDMIEALRFAPLDPSIAVAAAVQSQTSMGDARHRAAIAGMDGDDFDLAFKVAGSPPGIVEMIELWQRGDVDQGDVEQTIRESRTKTKYIPALLKLRRRLLPADTIASMVGQGVLTDREGLAKLMEHGYTHQDAAAWIDKATTDTSATTRDLAKSEILALYGAQAISRGDAKGLLESAKYSGGEADLLLDLTDSKRVRAYRDAAVSRVHSLYVAFRLDRSDAGATLDRLSVPSGQVKELIHIWDLERQANQKDLTKAEIVSAYGHEIFTLREAMDRLAGIGYSGADAAVILAEHAPAPARDKALTTAQIISAVKRGALAESDANSRLRDLGYSAEDARLLLAKL
jgi:hypothetical protein